MSVGSLSLLHGKDLSCIFRNIVGVLQLLQKTKCFDPTQLSILFQWHSKLVDPVHPPLPFSLYIFLNIAEILHAGGEAIDQSINQP